MARIKKIVGMVNKVLLAQDNVTHLNELGQGFAEDTKRAIKYRDGVVTELIEFVTELEKQLADLTPHPDDADYEADYNNHSRGW